MVPRAVVQFKCTPGAGLNEPGARARRGQCGLRTISFRD